LVRGPRKFDRTNNVTGITAHENKIASVNAFVQAIALRCRLSRN